TGVAVGPAVDPDPFGAEQVGPERAWRGPGAQGEPVLDLLEVGGLEGPSRRGDPSEGVDVAVQGPDEVLVDPGHDRRVGDAALDVPADLLAGDVAHLVDHLGAGAAAERGDGPLGDRVHLREAPEDRPRQGLQELGLLAG
ncbi:hypothetical protein ADL26_13545, partial [Thermoactinomyces vulgaris]